MLTLFSGNSFCQSDIEEFSQNVLKSIEISGISILSKHIISADSIEKCLNDTIFTKKLSNNEFLTFNKLLETKDYHKCVAMT